MPGRLTVVLADDHKILREAMVPVIKELGDDVEVIEAGSLDEVLDIAARPLKIDLMIIDLYMPGMHGVKSLKALRALRPTEPLAIFTGSMEESDIGSAVDFGVSAYLPKTMAARTLVSAMRLTMNGERYIPVNLYEMVYRRRAEPAQSQAQAQESEPAAGPSGLTARQYSVLREVVAGRSNKEIARALDIQEITVKVHLQGVFKRLNVKNRTQAAIYATEHGWF